MFQYPHHRDTLQLYLDRAKADPEILCIAWAGPWRGAAPGRIRTFDLLVCVSDARCKALEAENRLCETIVEERFYKGGYYDIKYFAKDYLAACARKGSEPARNAWAGARVVYCADARSRTSSRASPSSRRPRKEEKMLSFAALFEVSHVYFWNCCVSGQDAPYLKIKTAADLALSGLRLFLQEREMLFPCQRKLLGSVRAQPGGAPLADAAEAFLRRLDDESERAFYAAVWQSVTWTPPEDYKQAPGPRRRGQRALVVQGPAQPHRVVEKTADPALRQDPLLRGKRGEGAPQSSVSPKSRSSARTKSMCSRCFSAQKARPLSVTRGLRSGRR